MLGVRSLSLPFSADRRSHFVCFFAAPILQYSTLQHSNLPRSPLRAPRPHSTFGIRRWALGVCFSVSSVTTPAFHCFARDLLLCCFMTKSRCWPAHSRHEIGRASVRDR